MIRTPKTPLPPPPVGLVGTYLQPYQNRSRHCVSLLRTPAIFRPPPVPAFYSSYSIEGVVCNTIARENVQSSTRVLYIKTFRANHVDKARLKLVRQIESKQQTPFSATTISVNDPSKLVNHYSLSKTVTECKPFMCKYSVNAVFKNVKPFGFDGPNTD